jgi:hypothetical protein
VHSQISFEEPSAHFQIDGGVDELTVEYRFKNLGSTPAFISRAQPDCDCIRTRLDKNLYLPAESGIIKVFCRLGGRTGNFQWGIDVFGGPAETTLERLLLAVDVVARVKLDPSLVEWKQSAAPEEKTIGVTAITSKRIDRIAIEKIVGWREPEYEVAIKGVYYIIHLTPRHYITKAIIPLRVHVWLEDNTELRVTGFAYFR